jgi:hypothetical protein
MAKIFTGSNKGQESVKSSSLEVDGSTLVVDEKNDRVGIGTKSPISELSVAGIISITSEQGSTPSQPVDGSGLLYTKSDGKVYWRSNDVSETDLTATGGSTLTTEQVQDIVGAMLEGTETRIAVTYDDDNGRINFVVDDMTADTNTTYSAATNGGIGLSGTAFSLDIDGMNDIGAGISSTDLIIIDDGANGTNRKSAVSRLETYMQSNLTFTTNTDTQLTTEAVQDIVGAMLEGTETRIAVTYDDDNGRINFVVDDLNTDTQLTSEQVQDIVGAMFSSNTETRITATYQDEDGTIDLVVDDLNTDTQLTSEQVQDIVGAMFTGNTETGISATYEDEDGTIDLVVSGGSGETNTASNVGSGSGTEVGVFKQKSGVDFEFKKLKQGAGITLESNASDITITNNFDAMISGDGAGRIVFSNGNGTFNGYSYVVLDTTEGPTLTVPQVKASGAMPNYPNFWAPRDDSATTALNTSLAYFDYNKSGVKNALTSSEITGLTIDMDDTATNNVAATVTMKGIDIDINSANAQGTINNIGVDITMSANADLVLPIRIEGGPLAIKETTTPPQHEQHGQVYYKNDQHLYFADGAGNEKKLSEQIICIACSDETTDLTTGTAKATFHMPYTMIVETVKATCTTAPAGSTITVDINDDGTTILSTKLTIDATEKTSTTAATAAVISAATLSKDSVMTIDIDQIGSGTAGTGLKVWLFGYVRAH